MSFNLLHVSWDDRNHIIDKVVARTPYFYAGRKAAEIANLELHICATRYAASRRDVRASPDADFSRKITKIVNDRVFVDHEKFPAPNSSIA
jgi:hypothetical protein